MINILSGDPQQVAEKVAAVTTRFVADNDALSVSHLSGEEVDLLDLKEQLVASSLFNPRRLLIVRDFDRCPQIKRAAKDGGLSTQALADLFEMINPANQLVITLSPDASNSTAVNWLRQHPNHHQYQHLRGANLVTWLVARAESFDSQLDSKTAAFLIDYYGHDSVGLATEIVKLSLHPQITQKLIEDVVLAPQPEITVFNLTTAIVNGQTDQALAIYESFRVQNSRSEALRGLLGLIIWQVRVLLAVNTSRWPIPQLGSELGLKNYSLSKVEKLARRLPGSVLVRLVDDCLLADHQIRVDYQSPADCLPSLIIRASTACR